MYRLPRMTPARLLGAAILTVSLPATAANIDFSGFATLTAGDVLSGSKHDKLNNFQCPCFIANYEYAGLYENTGWTAGVESTVGAQADIHIDDQLSATLQVDGHAVDGYQASLDWAYLSYRANNNWTLQAGHKRLPLYYYSDSNYIGYSYPWVRPPVDVYGWEIYSYDGVNAIYSNTVGDWALRTNVWAGSQKDNDSAMMGQIYNGARTQVLWSDIVGAAIDAGNDIVNMRLVYMQSGLEQTMFPNDGSTPVPQYPDGAKQRIYGAAFNVDYNNFLWRSEYNTFIRKAIDQTAPSFFTSAGYRLDDFTFLYTYSQYREELDTNYTAPQRYNTHSGTVRWDFRRKMALKAQIDRFKDYSTLPFVGNSTLLTLSLTTVF
ncbi:MAG TPA: hypothetical protein VFM34_08215 [Moraxellaceae bacterium]|nr:hypothetical protein [Moraxellaceae bacterium]